MADKDKDKQPEPPAPVTRSEKNSDRASNLWEFLSILWRDSKTETILGGVVAASSVVTFNEDLRELVMAGAGRSVMAIRRPYNWTVNHINAAVAAFVDGQLIQAVLGIVCISAAGQIADWEQKAKFLAIMAGLNAVLVAIVYGYLSNLALRVGLTTGTFSAEEVAAFKVDGGTSFIRLLFAGGRGAAKGALDGLWATGKKCARSILWFTIGTMYLCMMPFYRIPGLLWIAAPTIILFVVLHVLVEKAERGIEWDVAHNSCLILLFLVIGTFLNVPETFQWVTIPLGAANSFFVRVATTAVTFWGMKYVVNKSREAAEARAREVSGTSAPAPTKAEGRSAVASTPWGPNHTLGVVILTGLGVAIVAGCSTANKVTEGYTRANGNYSVNNAIVSSPWLNQNWAAKAFGIKTTSGILPMNMTGRDAGLGATTTASVVGSAHLDGVRLDTLDIVVATRDVDSGILIRDGETFEIEVLNGDYAFRGHPYNTRGTIDGCVLIPAHSPQKYGEDYRYFVDPRQPVGVLFVRPGLGKEPTVVGSGATMQSPLAWYQKALPALFPTGKQQLSFIFNVPQGSQFDHDPHGSIRVVVRHQPT